MTTPTSTEIVATNCEIWLDNAANVLTNISGSLNSVSFTPTNGVAEWHTFGTQWMQRRIVHKDMPIAINAVYTTDAAEAAQLIENWFFGGNDSPRSLKIYVPDSEVGAFTYTGEVVLVDYNPNADAEADDVVRLTINLAPDGVITRGTNAT